MANVFEYIPEVVVGKSVNGMMAGAGTPGAPGPWMCATVAGVVSPEKVTSTEIIVRSSLRTTTAVPVAVLLLGGTSFDPASEALNTFGSHVGEGVAVPPGVTLAEGEADGVGGAPSPMTKLRSMFPIAGAGGETVRFWTFAGTCAPTACETEKAAAKIKAAKVTSAIRPVRRKEGLTNGE